MGQTFKFVLSGREKGKENFHNKMKTINTEKYKKGEKKKIIQH